MSSPTLAQRLGKTTRVSENPASGNGYVNLDHPTQDEQVDQDYPENASTHNSKPPFAGPEQVLRYLGRYTHRVAISNHRLVALDGSRVTFRWKDRAHGDTSRLLTLDVDEFLRRFLLHLVPTGMMRIRHYGVLANPTRRRLRERSRLALATQATSGTDSPKPPQSALAEQDPQRCPQCRAGHLVMIAVVLPAVRYSKPTTSTRARAP